MAKRKSPYASTMGSTQFSRIPPTRTPQTKPIPGEEQKMAKNAAGGYAYVLGPFDRLKRFLILGSSAPQYYVSTKKLTLENARGVIDCLDIDPFKTIETIASVSESGRAAKNDAAVMALAIAMSYGLGKIKSGGSADPKDVRAAAAAAVPRIARIGTHRFHLADYLKNLRGTGPLYRRAFSDVFNNMSPMKLARQMTKYKGRDGWVNKDILVLAHPTPSSAVHSALYHWAVYGFLPDGAPEDKAITYLLATEALHKEGVTETEVIRAIEEHGLEREMIPTQFLKSRKVWEALLPNLGMEALIRNLGNLGSSGLLARKNMSIAKYVVDQLSGARVAESKLHPIRILAAMLVYKNGKGIKGDNTWEVVPQVVDALDGAFYLAFGNVKPTGKRLGLYLDVSGSMYGASVEGIEFMKAAEVAAAMAMVTYRTEQEVILRGFSTVPVDIPIRPKDTLDTVVARMANIPMGGTDCSIPMIDAMREGYKLDGFAVYTDNETWAGRSGHPSQLLRQYRQTAVKNAKLAVVATMSSGFTIADPDDPGMLDFVGFDTGAPELMSSFFRGELSGED